jgi:hypothetical protein
MFHVTSPRAICHVFFCVDHCDCISARYSTRPAHLELIMKQTRESMLITDDKPD